MSETAKRPGRKSAKTIQREREEKFYALVDRAQTLIELAMPEDGRDIKDIRQITGALKDLKDLIWDKSGKGENKEEGMVIKIEGDVE